MRPAPSFLVLASLLVGCATSREHASPTAGTAPAAAPAKDCSGVFTPVDFAAISIWPEAFKGELLVLEVAEPGTVVREGDVVARLDTRAIDEAIRKAELEARSAKVHHTSLVERQALDEEAAEATLQRARASLDRARRALEGWRERELAFARRADELQSRREQAREDDQVDELAQLRAMYEADELTDATEDIVLKRAERDLEVTRLQSALSRDRRSFNDELTRALEGEVREENLRKEEEALQRTLGTQVIDARDREDARVRSAATLAERETELEELRRDRELFVAVAPRDGVVLHGRIDQYRPGATPSVLERGSNVPARKPVLLVAAPAPVAVAVELPEDLLERARDAAAVTVRPVADPERELEGTLALEAFPTGKGDRAVFGGTVSLGDAEGITFGMHATVELAGGGS